jgi:hypothetical protein
MFPLAVGNQWVYDVNWNYLAAKDIGYYKEYARGKATLTITSRTVSSDSTIWFITQVDSTMKCSFHSLSPSDTTCENLSDSNNFVLIEKHDENHRLYRPGNQYSIYNYSVLPFGKNLIPHTVYRYQRPFISDTLAFAAQEDWFGGAAFTFTFVKGVGQIAVACTASWTAADFESSHLLVSSTVLGVDADDAAQPPEEFSLKQNYPNPFNPFTSIEIRVPRSTVLSLRIYNILGEEISTPINERKDPGTYIIRWDGSEYPTGVYFYHLQTGSFQETRKFLLIR